VRLVCVAGASCLILATAPGYAGRHRLAGSPSRNLWLSDIHFDPLALPAGATDRERQALVDQLLPPKRTSGGDPEAHWTTTAWDGVFQKRRGLTTQTAGADSNYRLLQSVLQQVKTQALSQDGIVICTGDILCHGRAWETLPKAYQSDPKTLQTLKIRTAVYVVEKLQQTLGNRLVLAPGNNDTVDDDYAIKSGSPLFAALARHLRLLASHADAQKTFAADGYCMVPDPGLPGQDLVVLNSVYWSARAHTISAPGAGAINGSRKSDPGERELDWLQETLTRVRQRGRKATLILHIPPGIDAYYAAEPKSRAKKIIPPLWKPEYQIRFFQILDAAAGTVGPIFAGHTHRDDFQVISDRRASPLCGVRTAPSVSPVFGNNPAFTVFRRDRHSGAVMDKTTHYARLEDIAHGRFTWQAEAPDTVLDGKPFDPAHLQNVARQVRQDTTLNDRWRLRYAAQTASAAIPLDQSRYYACAQTAFTPSDYTACVQTAPAPSSR